MVKCQVSCGVSFCDTLGATSFSKQAQDSSTHQTVARDFYFFCSITTALLLGSIFFVFPQVLIMSLISGLSNYDHDEVYSCVALYVHAFRLSLAYSSGSLWRIALSHNCGECVMSLSSLCGVRRKLESGWEGSRWKFPVSFWRININMCSVCCGDFGIEEYFFQQSSHHVYPCKRNHTIRSIVMVVRRHNSRIYNWWLFVCLRHFLP